MSDKYVLYQNCVGHQMTIGIYQNILDSSLKVGGFLYINCIVIKGVPKQFSYSEQAEI